MARRYRPSFWRTVGAYRAAQTRAIRRMFIPGYGKKSIFSFLRRRRWRRKRWLFRWKPPSRRWHGGARLLGSTMADLVGVMTLCMLPFYILCAAGRTAKRSRRRRLRAAGKSGGKPAAAKAKTTGNAAAKTAAPKPDTPPETKKKPSETAGSTCKAKKVASGCNTSGFKKTETKKTDISQRTETTPLRYDPINILSMQAQRQRAT